MMMSFIMGKVIQAYLNLRKKVTAPHWEITALYFPSVAHCETECDTPHSENYEATCFWQVWYYLRIQQ